MAALAIAVGVGAVIAVSGAGWAKRLDREVPPTALASAASLALLVVASVDSAALRGFSLVTFVAFAAAIALAGWLANRRRPVPHFQPAPDTRDQELLVLGVAGLALAAILLTFPVPLDTDAQGFGYLAVMIRDGKTVSSLAPWHPEITYLYSPGVLLLFAGLSGLVQQAPLSSVMMGATTVAAFVFIWLAWEFGTELGHQEPRSGAAGAMSHRWRWAAGVSAIFSVGLWTAFLDSHFTAIFGLLFALGCLTALLRFGRRRRLADAALSALFLSAVAASHPDMTIALGIGIASFFLLGFLAVDRPRLGISLAMAAIPFAAAALLVPWLTSIRPLLASGIRSPFDIDPSHARMMVTYHGLVGPILALLGAVVMIRRGSAWGLAMVGWWLATLDLSALGNLERALPSLKGTLFRFNYPFSLAWHAPIIPYLALTAAALVWLVDRLRPKDPGRWIVPMAGGSAALFVIAFALRQPLLDASKDRLGVQGALASANDIAAMRWLRDHTPSEARVLNYPGDYDNGRDWEAHWAPVIAERDSVYFRWQPFFIDRGSADGVARGIQAEQRALLDFWRDPADAANAALLKDFRIRYVLVPESVGDPASVDRAWRWAPPALLPGPSSSPSDAPYLELVFAAGGAQVYRVLP